MNKSISFNDVANLSAYLDNQLPQAKKTRLERQLTEQQGLVDILIELQDAKRILRQTPRRRAPRNFTLTPRMAGLKPPVPRLVPAFSWASAVAMVLFILTLGTNLVGRYSLQHGCPDCIRPPGIRHGRWTSCCGRTLPRGYCRRQQHGSDHNPRDNAHDATRGNCCRGGESHGPGGR